MVEVDEKDEVLAEESCCGESHENLVLPSICRDLGNLDKPSSLVLLDIQVEPLTLQHKRPGCQVTLLFMK